MTSPVVPAGPPARHDHGAGGADQHDQGGGHRGRLELGGALVVVDVVVAPDPGGVALDHAQRGGDAAGRERCPQHVDQRDEEGRPGREAVGEGAAGRVLGQGLLDQARGGEDGDGRGDQQQQRLGVAQHRHPDAEHVLGQQRLGAGDVVGEGAVVVEPGEAERLAQPLVVALGALGDLPAPDLVHAGVEAVAPAGVVLAAGHQQGPGPLVVAALVEQRPRGGRELVVVEAEAGDDEAGVEHRAARGVGAGARARRRCST